MNKWKRIAIVAMVFVASFFVVQTPAHAGVPCPAAYLCTYEDNGFGGAMYYYTGPFNQCITIGPNWSGRISSLINNKSIPVRLYYNICSSNLWNQNMPPNSDKFNLGAFLDNHVHSMWIGFEPPH